MHMKQILLAFHNWHSTNGKFPPAANYGSDGKPKLSWRVALLPYLDSNDLFNKFHLNEPWDSPHNKALIAYMPEVFQTPDLPPVAPGYTRIRGFAGKGAMFEEPGGTDLSQVTDGTSNTLLITVANDAVPWTQPAELAFAEYQPLLPALDHSDPHGYTLGMTDGSVRSLSTMSEPFLRSLITRNGGEVIQWPQEDNRGAPTTVQPLPGFSPTPAPTPPPTPTLALAPGQVVRHAVTVASTPVIGSPPQPVSGVTYVVGPGSLQDIDQRLRKVEDKLEVILQKLNRLVPENTPLVR